MTKAIKKKVEQRKLIRSTGGGGGGLFLNRMVRVGLTEKVKFKQRLLGAEGGRQEDTKGKYRWSEQPVQRP